ncbi:TonB-dependent receptor [Flavisolibacter ginsengisoli]|uniref:TonB-dependent Receptor Plug Domain n=1 Tax=Flavisolibacter ginsengisoli DSM 18119 TaxID=1121884 RepID=A0A1M5F2N0_9BACT|nr:TonB-dependent receptor [Flavisolibacter ginsengisoli]SHF85638.1 TonB-dependent Receptor Plug Domain [Flavisolibacter ginsengisoli DSM 18119]
MLKRILTLLVCALAMGHFTFAQETNSSIGGIVKGSNNEPLVGATITAVHNPTGTVYRVISRTGGVFNISNMQPGGPYTITFSFVGFSDEKRDDVYLSLGQKSNFNVALADNTGNLTEVVIAARRAASSGRGGTETSIGRDKISGIPTVNRNLNDYLKYTPQAKVTTDGAGISIAGQNNRFNAFYIDGAINNDVFGLAASGTNGGQANINPISIDAIDQMQVVVSPYDASIGGFTGGGINATTRSGTNTFQGSAWGYYRNQDLAGKTPGDVPKEQRTKLANFKNQLYGFRIGGPIIKNKLFFFLLGETQKEIRPQPFDITTYRGNGNVDSINKLINFLGSTYGYDPGSYLDNPEKVNANRVTAKLDWNANSSNKVSLSYRYNDGERYNTSASSTTAINFYNNGYVFPTTSHTATGELKSNLKNGSSNRALVTYTNVIDNRNPIGKPFPRVTVNDGSGRYVFGTENFSTGNLLAQKNWTFYDAFKFTVGRHQFNIGTDNLYSDAKNVFIRDNFGTYTYASLSDFMAGNDPTRYQRTFSLLDNKDENSTASAAKFKYLNLAFFVNDELRVNDQLTLNFGIRLDKTKFLTDPLTDNFLNDSALGKISQYYDLKGARSGQISNVPWSISPRAGFTYRLPDENITVRGGLGIFTGRMPLVWPGGVYNNNGVSLGGIDPTATQIASIPGNFFRPDPYGQYNSSDFGISLDNAKGQIDIISKDFKLPQIFRTSLGVDKRFGDGWTFTVEGLYTKNLQEIYYQNVNIMPPTMKSAGPGSRNVYSFSRNPTPIPLRSNGKNPYTGIYLLYNNPGEKGYSYNFTFSIDKAFRKGWAFNANYVYGNSVVNNETTSSQNNSQWNTMETVNGRNFVVRSTSDFDLGHRISAYISKKFSYANNKLATTVSLVYNGQQGAPFSYIYSNSMIGDNGPSAFGDLIYIPTASEVQTMTFLNNTTGGVTYTADQQKQMLESYIQGNKYLSKNRGQFAERNADRLPFTHILDLQLQQDFNLKVGSKTYTVQLSYNVSNFTNMLNRNWGRTYFLNFDQYSLIQFAGYKSATDLTPQYRFSPQKGDPWGLSTSSIPGLSARWISQIGLRVNF